ncbi:VOC family protein [Nonomuraea sp. NPDC059194]|uniref:VOC family protein n=1 Tax=Nonomuraea sp. NPDC059194 TaxID=3346764 RepID=UPI00369286EE
MSLDHLVYAVPDLLKGVAEFAERTGVAPVKGGSHPGGTANYLVGLGPTSYLEIIGPDPEVEGARPRAFGLEELTEPRLAGWAIHPDDIDRTVEVARERGYDPGTVQPLSRRTPDGTVLEWRLTRWDNPEAVRPVPFLIDWGTTRHPAASGLPQVALASFTAVTPDVAGLRADLDAVGAVIEVEEGPEVGLRAVLDTPKGKVTLA